MSSSRQGPNWWIASDGKWYPPELHPDNNPVPPPPGAGTPGSGPYTYVRSAQGATVANQGTSGMAIASLVLSIVSIFGVGSILGIIFAIRAKRDIRASDGALGGDGLATAGFIVGIVTLVAGIYFLFSFFILTNQLRGDITGALPGFSTPITTLQMGEASPPVTQLGGGTITVYWVHVGVRSEDPAMATPATGETFAVARIKECAGPHGTTAPTEGPSTQGFLLSQPFESASSVIQYPNFVQKPVFNENQAESLAPRQCLGGLVSFAFDGNSVNAVNWETGQYVYSWTA